MRYSVRRFSCEFDYLRYPVARRLPVLSGFGLPLPFNLLFRLQAAVSLPGLAVPCEDGNGILTVYPSGAPLGSPLGPD